jgi:protein arginine N-methyltransferase 1
MYTISEYGNMYMHKARMSAFAEALRGAVTPNCVVLDIGAGTGIFALLACRYGARRVYAIEPANAINLAREMASANGCSDRVTFIQGLSTNVVLPERADVIISDLVGVLPLYGQHIPSITDARNRFMAPGGALIPRQDYLRAAIIEASEQYDKLTEPWGENLLGLNLSGGWPLVANTLIRLAEGRVKLLTRPLTLAVLDYRTIADSNLDGELTWTMDQPGTGHGVAVWFDRIVADGITISNEPGAPELVNTSKTYGQMFFPWPKAVGLERGDRVSFSVKADLLKDEYVWRWKTAIHGGQKIKAHFRQSSLHGHPLSREFLKNREAESIPAFNEDVRIDAFILSKIDGHTSLSEIACSLAANFPSRFNGWQDALSRVGDVAAQYSSNG